MGLPALGRPKEGRHHSRRRIQTPTRPPAARRVVQSTTPTGRQTLPPSLAGLAGPVRGPSGPPHHPDYKFRPPVLRLQSPLSCTGATPGRHCTATLVRGLGFPSVRRTDGGVDAHATALLAYVASVLETGPGAESRACRAADRQETLLWRRGGSSGRSRCAALLALPSQLTLSLLAPFRTPSARTDGGGGGAGCTGPTGAKGMNR